jgi:hypothetical protein
MNAIFRLVIPSSVPRVKLGIFCEIRQGEYNPFKRLLSSVKIDGDACNRCRMLTPQNGREDHGNF